ncbi:MAG: hypothetical protein HY878_00940, partial [Deltaproteobacteria bacterium]|nr:hypothetical protein [Deltaproteobacteria bacterium]
MGILGEERFSLYKSSSGAAQYNPGMPQTFYAGITYHWGKMKMQSAKCKLVTQTFRFEIIKAKALSYFLLIAFLSVYADCWAESISFSPALGISHPDKKVSSPSIASDKNGRIYIAWAREDADGANISIAVGTDFKSVPNNAVKVNPKGMGANGIHANPEIAAGSNNELYVLWSSPRKDDGSDILFSRSLDNEKTFEKPVVVNDAQSPVSRGFESIAVGKDGIIHIVWFDGREGKKDGTTG